MSKYRVSFVTNSSSSSFIGVFAEITDKEKAKKVIEDNELQSCIMTGKEILEDMSRKYFWSYGADWAGVDLTPNKKDIKEDAEYIVWESYGGAGDGDGDFMEDEYSDYNYDVCLSDFMGSEQNIYKDINEDNGFGKIDAGYGAGRNG